MPATSETMERLARLESQMESTLQYRTEMLATMHLMTDRIAKLEKNLYVLLGILGSLQIFGEKAVDLVTKAVQ